MYRLDEMITGKAFCKHKVQQTILNVGKDVFMEVGRKRKKRVLTEGAFFTFLVALSLCLR